MSRSVKCSHARPLMSVALLFFMDPIRLMMWSPVNVGMSASPLCSLACTVHKERNMDCWLACGVVFWFVFRCSQALEIWRPCHSGFNFREHLLVKVYLRWGLVINQFMKQVLITLRHISIPARADLGGGGTGGRFPPPFSKVVPPPLLKK